MDRVQDFPAMLRAALGDRVAADARTFAEMLSEDAVMEFPFAPTGMPVRLEGAAAVAEHLGRLARLITFDGIGPARVVASGPDVVVLTFAARGRGVATGAAYEQNYVSIVETRGGRIARYVDYWDPLALLRALSPADARRVPDLGGVYHA